MEKVELNGQQKFVLAISFLFFAIATGLQIREYEQSKDDYTLNYEYVNIKDMTKARVATKVSSPNIIEESINNIETALGYVEEVFMNKMPQAVNLEATSNSLASVGEQNKRVWYLPTQYGQISQYPNYNHVAYDITSWRGTAETVFPVANGKITGMYTDTYGALIVTILHVVDGKKYTSQYVHLSSYAPGIYVGKDVTINDAIGQMGSTGWSTGVHLHVAVLDCALFDPNDSNCRDLGAWYQYDKKRLSENYYGLGVMMYVPDSWSSR